MLRQALEHGGDKDEFRREYGNDDQIHVPFDAGYIKKRIDDGYTIKRSTKNVMDRNFPRRNKKKSEVA